MKNIYSDTSRAKNVGEGTRIGAGCDIGKDVEIGRGCNIQAGVFLSNGVKIGDGCFIGPGVHVLNDKYMNGVITPPTIGSLVRIGGDTTINPGVTVGDNAFIASKSLINKDVPPGAVVRGTW